MKGSQIAGPVAKECADLWRTFTPSSDYPCTVETDSPFLCGIAFSSQRVSPPTPVPLCKPRLASFPCGRSTPD